MLALNNQTKTGVKSDLIEKIADGIVLGVNLNRFIIFIQFWLIFNYDDKK